MLNDYAKFIHENLNSEGFVEIKESLDTESAVSTILKAIEGQKYLGLYYEDKDSSEAGFRLVEPFVLGQGFQRKGKPSEGLEDVYYLRAYVIRDSDKDDYTSGKFKDLKFLGMTLKKAPEKSKISSKGTTDWRLFRLDKIQKLKIFKETFEFMRPFYNPEDKSFTEILASVPKSDLKTGSNVNISDPNINIKYHYEDVKENVVFQKFNQYDEI